MPRAPRSITIHDVAKETGVSIKQVSRALRNEPEVSQATRALVLAAAERLNYRPSSSARDLRSAAPSVLGLVVLDFQDGTLLRSNHEYRMTLQMGALVACHEFGFGLRIEWLDQQASRPAEQLIERARSKEIGGFVLTGPTAILPGLTSALSDALIPYSVVGAAGAVEGAATVASNDRQAMREMTAAVLQAGHRRIAFIRGNKGWRDADERYAGYREALRDAGVRADPKLVFQGKYSFDSGREAAIRLLDQGQRPTAIMASSDDIAAGVIAVAHQRGLSLPDDLSITGFDDLDIAQKVWPPLTTVHRPIEKMAETAARQVIAMLRARASMEPLPELHVVMPSSLILRESLRPPAAPVVRRVS